MSESALYAPDYLRGQKDEQLHSIADMIEEQIKEIEVLKSMLWQWVTATPTNESGEFDEINQPQAFKAKKILTREGSPEGKEK